MNQFLLLTRGPRLVAVKRGECGKRKYGSQAKANKAMRLHGKRAGCKSVYHCPHCGEWHLTSQEQNND